MARAVAAPNEELLSFDDAPSVAWTLGTCAPGGEPSTWEAISGPMTVAAAWRELGRLDLDDPSTVERLDGQDHWFRAEVPAEFVRTDGRSITLELDGLATIVEVWLNGTLLTTSASMFVPVRVDVSDAWSRGGATNVIELRCRSLTSWLDATKWPRPRWRTKLVPEQRLRNVRTTVLGRIPSWSPPVPPVGPFREMRLRVRSGEAQHVPPAAPTGTWWPWTHGPSTGTARTIDIDRGADGEQFHVVVNGERVFCRGAVWMPIDPVSARSTRAQVRDRLELAKAAGFNMLRISGVTWYEEPHFYELCDELGILVWQDLALANMDPSSDPAYLALLEAEVRANLHTGPSLTVVCGSSETEQQATMVGLDPAVLDTLPMRTHVPGWIEEAVPGVAYVPSSPTGGHLPFSVDTGVGHYYGVGAYLRPLTDARHARVTFAAESLAFANVPRPEAVRAHMNDGDVAPTHPRWKARVPRDRGVGWDFEDVRDHYVRELFGVDPLMVRYGDPDRYLALGRAASAEVIARTYAELRRSDRCGGALVWTFNDLWAGAGWGIVDVDGAAKSPIGAASDVLAPVALFATDEGVNGVDLWLANDMGDPVEATLEVRQYRAGRVVTAEGSRPVTLAPRSLTRARVDDVIGRFTDPTGSYRFGPRAHDATAARLIATDGTTIVRALHVPDGVGVETRPLTLDTTAAWLDHRQLCVTLHADRVARHLTIEAGHRFADHDHTHLEPGHPLDVVLRYDDTATVPRRGYVHTLDADGEHSFAIPTRPDRPTQDVHEVTA